MHLEQPDFDRLVTLLSTWEGWQLPQDRAPFVREMFAGSPRRDSILGQIRLGSAPRADAVSFIMFLMDFGQDEPGRETLGVLINKLLSIFGFGDPANFLRGLLTRYPFSTAPVSTQPIDAWQGHEDPQSVQEKIIGENTLRDVYLLELALRAARSVVHITTSDSLGSGFMIAPDLVMTNHHVIGSAAQATQCRFTFGYELDAQGAERPAQSAHVLQGGVFYTNADLDTTVVQIQSPGFTFEPLTIFPTSVRKEARVSIIQHPGGSYKKISMQNNFVQYADARVVQYTTSTEPGSSGSPVFNGDFHVVALHHAGGMIPEPSSTQRYLRNEGISMMSIMDDLRTSAPDILKRLTLKK